MDGLSNTSGCREITPAGSTGIGRDLDMTKKWFKDPITVATVVIAFATVINVLVSLYMGKKTNDYTEVTKNIYKASNRPYVGIDAVKFNKDDGKHLIFLITVKNFGSIPATNVRVSNQLILDGTNIPTAGYEFNNKHSNLFPQATDNFIMKVGSVYDRVENGSMVLDLTSTIKYRGVISDGTSDYEDRETWRYDSAHGVIFPIGASAK